MKVLGQMATEWFSVLQKTAYATLIHYILAFFVPLKNTANALEQEFLVPLHAFFLVPLLPDPQLHAMQQSSPLLSIYCLWELFGKTVKELFLFQGILLISSHYANFKTRLNKSFIFTEFPFITSSCHYGFYPWSQETLFTEKATMKANCFHAICLT